MKSLMTIFFSGVLVVACISCKPAAAQKPAAPPAPTAIPENGKSINHIPSDVRQQYGIGNKTQ